MQSSEEKEVAPEVLECYEYQVIQSAIEDLGKVLITIQDGMNDEFAQVQTLNRILDSQLKTLGDLVHVEVVSMEHVRTLKMEYRICLDALRKKADVVRNLNAYLGDRIKQMKLLQRKRLEIIKRFAPAQVIAFKGRNEKSTLNESGD